MLEDINSSIENDTAKPQMLTVTKSAAMQIKQIAKENNSEKQGLSVQAQRDGSFFMEFRKRYEEGEKEFFAREVPDVKVWASPLTLQRIGGATIDYREGRFKLDMA